MKHLLFALASLTFTVAGCTTSTPTGATCPTDNPPTYASFGQPFFTQYCTGCHSVSATDRHGAPATQNYDSEAEIRAHATEIDLWAAAGPDAQNLGMPDMSGPVTTAPTDAEREQLGQYLACLQGQ